MREEFPIFKSHPDLIYFDSAATTHKPKCVIDALSNFYANEYATVHRTIYRLSLKATDLYNKTRESVAKFLNANESEIIFTRGTTDSINLVARSYGETFLKEGDEILISEMEHHSNIVPWQLVAKKKGAHLKYIPMNEQGVLEWEGTITSKTKIVSLAHVSNVTGTINPIALIAEEAHKVGAIIVVDGAQAAAFMKIDVKALKCDFYAFSSHKCYGPTGVGVLFGKRELLESMPPVQGGGDMIERVDLEGSTYQAPPLRFEAGTPIIAEVVALRSALEFLENHRGENSLVKKATQIVEKIPGVKIIGTAANKGPIISFTIDGIHPLDLATMLDLKNVAIRSGHLCAQPLLRKFSLTSVARISFGLYNKISELALFERHLENCVKNLR